MDTQAGCEEQLYYPNYNKDDDTNETSVTYHDSLHDYVQFQSHVNADGLEESITFTYPGTNRTITLSTQLSEDDLAPIFDGSSWAGTRLWSASIFGIKYLVDLYHTQHGENAVGHEIRGKTLCELGSGLGVPSIIWHLMGGNALVTEHERIVSQLRKNMEMNFIDTLGTTIQIYPLNWSRAAFQRLLQDQQPFEKNGFDVIINCDCIFEPLYGKSWIHLADVIDESLRINPQCLVITSVERRAQDGIDHFLEYLLNLDHVMKVESVAVDIQVDRRLEIYVTKGHCE